MTAKKEAASINNAASCKYYIFLSEDYHQIEMFSPTGFLYQSVLLAPLLFTNSL
jgi:hypothetical protein